MANVTNTTLDCLNALFIPTEFRWVTAGLMGLIITVQVTGNSGIIWLHLIKLEESLTVGRSFIVALAFSDLTSGLSGIVGAYREDLGRTTFYWPSETF